MRTMLCTNDSQCGGYYTNYRGGGRHLKSTSSVKHSTAQYITVQHSTDSTVIIEGDTLFIFELFDTFDICTGRAFEKVKV